MYMYIYLYRGATLLIVLRKILSCEVSDGKRFILFLCLVEILISVFTIKYFLDWKNEGEWGGGGCAALEEEQKWKYSSAGEKLKAKKQWKRNC